eukprot:COSAG01_NODE_770_length_13726_cov_66.211639_5_plen_91_part_00
MLAVALPSVIKHNMRSKTFFINLSHSILDNRIRTPPICFGMVSVVRTTATLRVTTLVRHPSMLEPQQCLVLSLPAKQVSTMGTTIESDVM